MPFTTYILYSATLDKFYIGYTGDEMNSRLRKHLSDHDGFTAKANDWIIVWNEQHNTKEAAYAREREIKGWKSKKMILKLIQKHSPARSEHPDI